MKKLILFIIIINLFAKNVVDLNHTQKNNDLNISGNIIDPALKIINDLNISENIVEPTHKTIVGYKKNFIDKVNYFTPDFLQISKETSSVKLKIYYDSLTQKNPTYSIHVHIKLPEFFLKKTTNKIKTKNNIKINKTITFQFKLRPILKLVKNKFFFFQNIMELDKTYLNNKFSIANKINYYPFYKQFFTESLTFAYYKYLKRTYGITLNFSTNQNTLPDLSYAMTAFIANFKNKLIGSMGYTIGGSTNNNPIIYYHKIFMDLRKALFNKKYIYLDVTPYILVSRDYHYKIEPAIYTSLNIQF
jgi:hypothetical protein